MNNLEAGGETFNVSRANGSDVAELVSLLADDILDSTRKPGELDIYLAAFDEIDADPNQFLAVVRDSTGDVCGTFPPILGLARGGAKRFQIEGVRLASSARDRGLGSATFARAYDDENR